MTSISLERIVNDGNLIRKNNSRNKLGYIFFVIFNEKVLTYTDYLLMGCAINFEDNIPCYQSCFVNNYEGTIFSFFWYAIKVSKSRDMMQINM